MGPSELSSDSHGGTYSERTQSGRYSSLKSQKNNFQISQFYRDIKASMPIIGRNYDTEVEDSRLYLYSSFYCLWKQWSKNSCHHDYRHEGAITHVDKAN